MTLEITFKQVCNIIKKDEPDLLKKVDQLLGLALVCAPVLIGAELAALLPALAVKNELTKIGKEIFDKYAKKKEEDYLANLQRMQTAYGLLCFTAFFEALDKQIPTQFRSKLALLDSEKEYFAKKAIEKMPCLPSTARGVTPSNPFAEKPISFPHPTESVEQQKKHLQEIWKGMTQGFLQFIQSFAIWEQADENAQKEIIAAISKVPEVASNYFDAQYYELSRRYQDFAVWANLQEHRGMRVQVEQLSDYLRNYSNLTNNQKNIDIGFERLRETVLSIPEILQLSRVSMANRIEPFLAINFEPLFQRKITYSVSISVDSFLLPA